MAKKDLETLTKRIIGYTEEIKRCDQCRHSEEKEYPMGGCTYWICNFSNVISISVEAHGRCKHFDKREVEK